MRSVQLRVGSLALERQRHEVVGERLAPVVDLGGSAAAVVHALLQIGPGPGPGLSSTRVPGPVRIAKILSGQRKGKPGGYTSR